MTRALLVLLLFAGAALWPGPRPAVAATTCTATMTNLGFGTVDPGGGAVDATATLSYACTYNGGLLGGLSGDFIRLCFSLGAGDGGTGWTPRTLRDAAGDTMDYQLYADAARSQVWGSTLAPGIAPRQATMQFTILSSGSSQSGSVTVYGRVPAGQTALRVGSYASLFANADAHVDYAYAEALLSLGTYPATCASGASGNGSATFSFAASAGVVPHCRIGAASDLDFGSVPSAFAADLDRASGIDIACTAGTAWQIGLDDGRNALAGARRMLGGGRYVGYELYRDEARTQRWGRVPNVDTLAGSGTGTTQTLPVRGRVTPQPGLVAGSYSDKITVTVTY